METKPTAASESAETAERREFLKRVGKAAAVPAVALLLAVNTTPQSLQLLSGVTGH